MSFTPDTAMSVSSNTNEAESMMSSIRPIPPVGVLPPSNPPVLNLFSVSIGTANPAMGHAWILTPSQRPNVQGHWFAPRSRVEIFASPAPGFVFSHWTFTNHTTGNITVAHQAVMAFIVWGHTVVTAHFAPIPRPRPPVRPPIRPVPPIGTTPPRPPVRPIPPIGTTPPRPPVRPVPLTGALPTSHQVEFIDAGAFECFAEESYEYTGEEINHI